MQNIRNFTLQISLYAQVFRKYALNCVVDYQSLCLRYSSKALVYNCLYVLAVFGITKLNLVVWILRIKTNVSLILYFFKEELNV